MWADQADLFVWMLIVLSCYFRFVLYLSSGNAVDKVNDYKVTTLLAKKE